MTGMTLDDTAPMTGLLLSGHLRETPTSHCNRHSHKRPGKRDRRLNAVPSCGPARVSLENRPPAH